MPFVDESTTKEVSIGKSSLLRLSGAQVDPYTRYVAYLIFRKLNLSVKGQRHMNNAFANLPIFTTDDQKLTFGWGFNHAVQDKVIHAESYDHLAVATAIGESFHEVYGTKILHELAASMAGPEDTTPHYAQWKSTLHSCNGILATTDFGQLVEDYLRLDPFSIRAVKNLESIVSPKAVAQALQALMQVSGGHEKTVTFTGSGIISWFGALAEWHCDLRVEVYGKDATLVHATHKGQKPQVTLVFVEKPGIEVSFQPWYDTHVNLAGLNISENTYSSQVYITPFSGRVAWQSLLPRVFGKSFHYLDHDESKAFGGMIGGAAKLFEGLALGKGHEEHALVSTKNQSNTASYGAGLIQTITNWLPELRRFQGRMERALKLTHEDAAIAYTEYLSKLRRTCHCGICTAKDEVEKEKEGLPPSHGYCLAVIVETIISLGLVLSRMTVSPSIVPSRAGIQGFYNGQVQKRMEARGLHWTEHFKLVYGNEWNAPDARRLQKAVQIFAGSSPEKDLPSNVVALSHEGICAYFVTIGKPWDSTTQDQVKLIRIVSGGINVREKVFDRAALGPVETQDPDDFWEEVPIEHLPQSLFCK
ncbi:hypothetical protein PV10_07316 [Exophiala mesophila]|uniref:Uncharacterized protein n=1 Tax=Exophiala mesophila TaxID=212818 RepID=A0A0D1ZT50_EXOME|nr:uncharacterized protein PV10_07316 [Exophiala mesophila]KIV89963.1 hypothetical protein PV10_07316 [Exophiala mesophila]